jgi:predicted nucleic acid-binding protein
MAALPMPGLTPPAVNMKRSFIDSNIIVYANDSNAGAKQHQAIDIVKTHLLKRSGVISTQVMQEYANVAITKLKQESSVVLRQLRLLENFHMAAITPKTTRRAVEILTTYQLSFWDANIIAAAEDAECELILSEHLNTGQFYAGIEVVNPFTSP